MRTILSFLLVFTWCTAWAAEGEKPAEGDDRQLAIALGSALMARENGKDPQMWKEVSAISNCAVPPVQTRSTDDRCRWSVYFVTKVFKVTCPTGNVLDGLEGDGVHLYSRDDYKFFRWIRQPVCTQEALK